MSAARTPVCEDAIVRLAPYARLKEDKIRQCMVLLAPERVLFPCPTTVMILERLDGSCTLRAVVDRMADEFEAPREVIAADTLRMLADLDRQALLDVQPVETGHARH
ncbi:pyrroloquinoline quinone biosynthesis protein D/pyrroloquinoline quinone biosynthesis protein E [Arboricoccus pini]|uniref:Pyrroloquinoline quinone biosynthesis protein D/pyrroloquinoline quinone biosynthesis protein E n=1 Tax=Arboricoccus pini TaxID=1963835 RepID=A0A212RWK5_9PROT|nr:pyrroloquinoline quinone biosynthesis peptide chaperone PqqD [Arboricoccus pini]SNB77018.1 pyrroloquinoline quinone biosynthesis protein D/pyrroloquinoline quinone biosynthesis protein E [Arboricoccus pini]